MNYEDSIRSVKEILTISEITSEIKRLIEEEFDSVSLIGEISNFKPHFSGHWYFTLKDQNAQINCTMWKGMNSYVFFTPQDGMKVIVNGKLNVYPPRGTYQVDVRSMKPAGEGELQAAFEKLKAKLSYEGLFDVQYKKSIPRFPEKIGIVTAIDGAALRDMISVASRRYPVAELVIASSKVQGEGAAEEIVKSIKQLDNRKDIDVIIVGRGGGSIEDLWAFNEEIVARAIFECKIPVISAVGHEIDFTISDFVADLRAPTPTAAMELATPDKEELFAFISDFSYNSSGKILRTISNYKQEISFIINSYGFRNPKSLINNRIQQLDNLLYRINISCEKGFKGARTKLELAKSTLHAYNVEHTLKRGFTIIRQKDKTVKRGSDFKSGQKFTIKFFDKEVTIKYDEEKRS